MTGADRQRRHRAHKRGDHSWCDPGREDCGTVTVTPSVTRNAVTTSGVKLGERGRRLWRQLVADGPPLKPAEQVLAEEACRTTDRLDVLDRILRGDEDSWLRLALVELDGSVVRVVVNGVMAEVRQQQIALKQLLGELRQSRSVVAGKPGRAGAQPPVTGGKGVGGVGVTDLTARIAARSAQATG